ncbi:MAG TPA: hypothetical protein VM597_07225 [Gemmataceae bacterium]|nr:hypothetical protein [Gemmataceae bacterium]
MSSILIALWSCPTSHSTRHCQKAPSVKYLEMDKALEMCSRELYDNANAISKSNPFQVIFAAPEYYFTAQGNQRTPLDESARAHLEGILLGMSRKYCRTLIVPGTLYYQKPLLRPVGTHKLDRRTGKIDVTTAPKDRRDKALGQLSDVMFRDVRDPNTRLMITNEALATSNLNGVKGPTGLPMPSLVTRMEALAEKTSAVVRNATYLFLNGTRHGKYDKQSDYFESMCSPDDMVFVPGTRDECPVIGRHRFGVEICADHAYGRLMKRNPAGLHFHVVASDCVDNVEAHMAMTEHGYFLHASSDEAETGVHYKDANGRITELLGDEYLYSEACGDGKLHYYLVKLPPTPGGPAK